MLIKDLPCFNSLLSTLFLYIYIETRQTFHHHISIKFQLSHKNDVNL